ncbi:uncharacterized protein [Amphiura filiformis]|uniref:uncharacterized protein n=1 Tax=Amphiura filiformis TaxID=82378 RepID=UPI003B218E88
MAIVVELCILLVLQYLPETKATTVEVTVPVHPVTVGGILAIQCEIQNMEDGHTVKMFRVINDQTEEITSGMVYQHIPTLGQRVFITQKVMQGGALMYFMTITEISMQDKGEYLCKVFALSRGNYETIAEDSANIEVYFLPDRIYPQCQSNPSEIKNIHENVDLRFICISSRGVPEVNLRWKATTNLNIVSQNHNRDDNDDTVSSKINLRTTRSHNGVVFVCEMTSEGFPDFIRTCQIGPITIRRNIEKEGIAIIPPIVTTETVKQITIPSHDCTTACPSEDKFTILYLSVATIGAAMLCFVFLTTTIIWCYKYNTIYDEARDAQRNATAGDGSEPVYVSLQGRPDNDRNSGFMSVDDPNNPGSKVLMPKEVFDEFYRSLSLKKGLNNRENVQV